jgi:RHS repeat-associated protein
VSNLFDFPAREYNSIHGRWPSPDPAGISSVRLRDPQTLNRYAYVRNSPLRLTDPSGMDPCDGGDGVQYASSGDPDGGGDQSAALRHQHRASASEPVDQAPSGGPGGLDVGGGGGGGGCGFSIDDPLVDDSTGLSQFAIYPADGSVILGTTNDLAAVLGGGLTDDELSMLYDGTGSDYLPPTALSTLPLLNSMETNIGQVIGIVAGGDALVAGGVAFAPVVGAVVDTGITVGTALGTDPGVVGAVFDVLSGVGSTAYTATPVGALAGAIGACMSVDGCMDPLQ